MSVLLQLFVAISLLPPSAALANSCEDVFRLDSDVAHFLYDTRFFPAQPTATPQKAREPVFTADGKLGARMINNRTLEFFDPVTDQPVRHLQLKMDPNKDISFGISNTGKYVAVADQFLLTLVEVESGTRLNQITLTAPHSTRPVFSGDDKYVLIGLGTGVTNLIDVKQYTVTGPASQNFTIKTVAINNSANYIFFSQRGHGTLAINGETPFHTRYYDIGVGLDPEIYAAQFAQLDDREKLFVLRGGPKVWHNVVERWDANSGLQEKIFPLSDISPYLCPYLDVARTNDEQSAPIAIATGRELFFILSANGDVVGRFQIPDEFVDIMGIKWSQGKKHLIVPCQRGTIVLTDRTLRDRP